MGSQDLSQVPVPTKRGRTSKQAWKFGRLLLIALVISVTIIAYFLPAFPYQLPLCLFKLMTGYPCAGCGMTRAFEAAAHGRFREAFEWHPIGLVFFVAAWVGVILCVYELLTNKPFDWDGWLKRYGALLAWLLFFALIGLWLLRLSYYRFGQWLPLPLKVPL
ncbi:MAG: DUF2752 domain-containing protein [Armatimonadetes bacterium]|nr:DUF2752 domain-containing protein [Armatimonadota bacterium]